MAIFGAKTKLPLENFSEHCQPTNIPRCTLETSTELGAHFKSTKWARKTLFFPMPANRILAKWIIDTHYFKATTKPGIVPSCFRCQRHTFCMQGRLLQSTKIVPGSQLLFSNNSTLLMLRRTQKMRYIPTTKANYCRTTTRQFLLLYPSKIHMWQQ